MFLFEVEKGKNELDLLTFVKSECPSVPPQSSDDLKINTASE